MPQQPLIALRPMTYRTRRLQPGDAFQAPWQLARIFKAQKKARDDYDAPVRTAIAEAAAQASAAVADLDTLRADAEALGIRVDRRWGEARIRQEMDAAKATAQQASEADAPEVAPPAEIVEPQSTAEMVMTTENAGSLVPHDNGQTSEE